MQPPRHLLLVEDDRVVRRACEAGLTRRGYSVVTAATGPLGLERALAEDFDLILLDLQLPGMNGRELLGSLRARRPDSPPALILSNSLPRDTAGGFDGLGVVGFLVKASLSLDALAAHIATVTRGASR